MSPSRPSFVALILRIAAGILALVSFVLVGLRLYGYSHADLELRSDAFTLSLQLLFPLSLGLMFGYMALTGKMPFMDEGRHPRNNAE
jgi:hypothetical protein